MSLPFSRDTMRHSALSPPQYTPPHLSADMVSFYHRYAGAYIITFKTVTLSLVSEAGASC